MLAVYGLEQQVGFSFFLMSQLGEKIINVIYYSQIISVINGSKFGSS